MWREDAFAAAARRAARAGTCPIGELDDLYTNHWDVYELCSGFRCAECVASPEDLGYYADEDGGPLPEEGPRGDLAADDWEIGF